MTEISKITVYAASSSKSKPAYIEAATQLGIELAQNKKTVVYGGGSIGLMGALANAVLENKGELIGIIPRFMMELEWGNPNVSQMIITETLAERKTLLINKADAVIFLPGGSGTLEELSEAISLKKLGLIDCPLVFLNTNGFFDSLLAFYERMISDNFLRVEHRGLWEVANEPSDIWTAFENSKQWGDNAIELAGI
jgi:uncharacterized protein (TIGR00730 family)